MYASVKNCNAHSTAKNFVIFTERNFHLGFLVWLLRGLLCSARHDPSGKAVLITGCDTGIGNAVARHLDQLGCLVFAGCADTASEGAQRLRLEATGRLQLVNMDLTRKDGLRVAVDYVETNLSALGYSGLWAVINNAGVAVCGEFDWQTIGQVEHQVDVNLLGMLRLTKLCLPLLKKGNGRLVNVSSVAGIYGYPGLSVYCATKHAMEGFSQVLRVELAKFGLEVVTIQPGDFSKATHLLNNHHSNMNQMWAEMSDESREEYKQYFLSYHDSVAKSGFTGRRLKPVFKLPHSLLVGFERAVLARVPRPVYRLMPTWRSRVNMFLLGLLPTPWARYLMTRR